MRLLEHFGFRKPQESTVAASPVEDPFTDMTALDAFSEMSRILFTAREERRRKTSEEGILLDELAMQIIKETGSCPQDVEDAIAAMDNTHRRIRFVQKELQMIINGAEFLNRGGKHGVRKITYVPTTVRFNS